jgi:hypothetical protein
MVLMDPTAEPRIGGSIRRQAGDRAITISVVIKINQKTTARADVD